MTAQAPETQAQETAPQSNAKELNFRKQEAMYQRMLQEKEARIAEVERQLSQRNQVEEEDDTSEPYVDHKKLDKKLAKFGEAAKQSTKNEIQQAVQAALQDERRQNWIKSNPDFYTILNEENAEKFAQANPDLADSIMAMPDGFEKQRLVYSNIKALKLHLPPEQKSTIQDKINANRQHPGFQPSSVGTAPYAQTGDFSGHGQKQAYQKMQELKSRLSIQ